MIGQTLTELFNANRGGAAEAAIAQIQGDHDITKQLFVASPPFSQGPTNSLGSFSASLMEYLQRKGDEGPAFQKPENPYQKEESQTDQGDFPGASGVFS